LEKKKKVPTKENLAKTNYTLSTSTKTPIFKVGAQQHRGGTPVPWLAKVARAGRAHPVVVARVARVTFLSS